MPRHPPRDEPAFSPEPRRALPDWPGLVACAAAAVVVLALSWFKLSSLDLGYHLAYGRHFLDTGQIVDRDPFLYPETAVPFVNANWGSQVIMALAERAAGPHGLFALRLTLIAVIFTCIAAITRHLLLHSAPPNPQSAISNQSLTTDATAWVVNGSPSRLGLWLAAAWLFAALAAYERFSMRPELFSYAAMSSMLWLLVRGLRSWRTIVVLGLLQLLWVNLHSYFLVGLLFTGGFLVSAAAAWIIALLLMRALVGPTLTAIIWMFMRPWLRENALSIQTSRRSASAVRVLATALAVQLAVCFVNPWHYHGAVFPLKTLQFLRGSDVMGGAAGDAARSAWAEISEFQSPFSFSGQIGSARTIHAYYLLLAVAGIGVLALARQGQIGSVLALLVLFAMSTQMRRNIAQFAFVAAPFSIGAIAAFVSSRTWSRSLRHTTRLILLSAILALSAWWTYDITCGRFYYVERRITREFGAGYSDRTFPRAAAQWLTEHPGLKPNLYIDYFSSSNALTWLPDRFKLYVNTNTFAYSDDTLRTAFQLGLGELDHRPFFERYGVNVVLLHCGPDTQMLVRRMLADDGDWALAYFDRQSVVFVRRIPEHLDVIPSTPMTAASLSANDWLAAVTGPRYARALTLGTIVNVPMSLGWWAPAAALMDEAVKLAPDYFEAWNYLGVCHGNLGNAAARSQQYADAERQWQAAIRCWKTVLSLSPGHAEASAYLERTRRQLDLLRQPN